MRGSLRYGYSENRIIDRIRLVTFLVVRDAEVEFILESVAAIGILNAVKLF